MRWSDAIARPTNRQLRQFGGAIAVLCLGVGATLIYRHANSWQPIALIAAAVAVALVAGWRPQWLAPVFTAAKVAVFPLAWTLSLVLLTLVFYGLVTPLGLALRFFGRDPLDRKLRPDQHSYWAKRPGSDDPKSYFRQF